MNFFIETTAVEIKRYSGYDQSLSWLERKSIMSFDVYLMIRSDKIET